MPSRGALRQHPSKTKAHRSRQQGDHAQAWHRRRTNRQGIQGRSQDRKESEVMAYPYSDPKQLSNYLSVQARLFISHLQKTPEPAGPV